MNYLFDGLDELLESTGSAITDRLRSNLQAAGGVATGRTLNSIRHEVEPMELIIRYKASLNAHAWGLGPRVHSPNKEKIVQWMKAKGIQPRRKGRFVAGTEANYKRSAFAIARAIYKNGTIKRFSYQGSGILEKSYNRGHKGALTKALKKLMADNVRKQVKTIFVANGFTNK